MNFNQKKGVAYLTEKQHELINKLPEEISLVMIGCDTEFLQNKKEAIRVLETLSTLGKDLSVITKLTLTNQYIERLRAIAEDMEKRGNLLALSVSLTCDDSAKLWEPRVPSPARRVETLRAVYDAGIKTMVALRPLLPTITEEELARVVEMTRGCCFGYYSGPLYLKSMDHPLLPMDRTGLKVERLQPHWMPVGNEFYRVEKEGQMNFLRQLVGSAGRPMFDGAAEGIKYLKGL